MNSGEKRLRGRGRSCRSRCAWASCRRTGACDGEGVTDGLVAVGVGEDDVVLCDDAVADDLVGAGGSAEDVEGPVGTEDAGGVALGFAGGPR